MPLPKPNANEDKDKFLSRCMGNSVMVREYGDQKQRYAVCMTQWKNKDKKMLSEEQIGGWWDVLSPGKWKAAKGGDVDITPEMISSIARGYSQELQVAPVTIDHQQEGPAYGWVEKLRVAGNKLQAKFRDLAPQMQEWLASRAYSNKSCEIYLNHASTGEPYLRAVTFLGAAAPAAKGLNPLPATFAEETDFVSIEDDMKLSAEPDKGDGKMDEGKIAEKLWVKLKEFFSKETPNEEDDKVSDDIKLKELQDENVTLKESLDGEKTAREKAEKELAELKAEQEEKDKEVALSEFKSGIEKARDEYRITPADADRYLKLAENMGDEDRKELLEDVTKREPVLLFKELTKKDGDTKPTGRTARLREDAEAVWAVQVNPDPEDQRISLRAFDLMDADENLSLEEAQRQAASESE